MTRAIGTPTSGAYSVKILPMWAAAFRSAPGLLIAFPDQVGRSRSARSLGMEPSPADHDFIGNVIGELSVALEKLGLVARTMEGEEDPGVVDRLAVRAGAEAL